MSTLSGWCDWELEFVATFLDMLYSGMDRSGGVDRVCWTPSSQITFEVESFYRVILCTTPLFFPWKSVWKPKVPSKVIFFIWTAALGKILTVDNLRL
jgi:hypothetical protein